MFKLLQIIITTQGINRMSKRLVIDSRSKGDGSIITGNFNKIVDENSENAFVAMEEMRIAKAISTRLVRAYNNRQWKINVDIKGGMLIIACDSISNNKGYHIHMKSVPLHELEEKAVRAAGEILERHGLSRLVGFNADTYEDLPRDLQDNVIGPDSMAEAI
jgi:hypothetical protein